MAEFSLRPKARKDLTNIWSYFYETWGEDQTDSYIHDLDSGFRALEPVVNLAKTSVLMFALSQNLPKFPYFVIASRDKRHGDPESLDYFVANAPRNDDQ